MTDRIPFDTVITDAIATLRRKMLDDVSIGQYLLALLMVRYASKARFDLLLRHATESGNAKRIEDALLYVEKSNATLVSKELGGPLFSHSGRDSSLEVNRALGDVIQLFSGGEALAAPGTGRADLFERLLEFVASSSHGRGGEFFTPRGIVTLMVDMLSPQSGEVVYDPVCGTGGFLVGALNHVRKNDAAGTLKFFGHERSETAARIAAINLHLHGIDQKSVYPGDALLAPIASDFDIAISNPPFSETREDLGQKLRELLDRFVPGVPPPRRSDYAFMLRMLASLKPGTGRMAVIMPIGALFRGGSEQKLRKHLIERNLLDAVIALPPKIFPGTAIATVVMAFRHDRKDDAVLFIDAIGQFEPGRKRNVLRDEHIDRIVETYRKRSESDRYARLVSREEIAANEFDLNISRYVDRGASVEAPHTENLSARESDLRAELADIQRQIADCLNELRPNF